MRGSGSTLSLSRPRGATARAQGRRAAARRCSRSRAADWDHPTGLLLCLLRHRRAHDRVGDRAVVIATASGDMRLLGQPRSTGPALAVLRASGLGFGRLRAALPGRPGLGKMLSDGLGDLVGSLGGHRVSASGTHLEGAVGQQLSQSTPDCDGADRIGIAPQQQRGALIAFRRALRSIWSCQIQVAAPGNARR